MLQTLDLVDIRHLPAAAVFYELVAFSCPTQPLRSPSDRATLILLEDDKKTQTTHAVIVRLQNMVKPRHGFRKLLLTRPVVYVTDIH
jgi:hypothetical protein